MSPSIAGNHGQPNRPSGWSVALAKVRSLMREHYEFNISAVGKRMPVCRIRPYRAEDFPAVSEIYLSNESAMFPAGQYPYWSGWLEKSGSLILVVEEGSEVRGVGGISRQQVQDTSGKSVEIVWISFGMIHPAHQRRGLGTALLMARLACLSQGENPSTLFMTTARVTDRFYRRFGFNEQGTTWIMGDREIDTLIVSFGRHQWILCRHALAKAGIEFDPGLHEVPLREDYVDETHPMVLKNPPGGGT